MASAIKEGCMRPSLRFFALVVSCPSFLALLPVQKSLVIMRESFARASDYELSFTARASSNSFV